MLRKKVKSVQSYDKFLAYGKFYNREFIDFGIFDLKTSKVIRDIKLESDF